jgi:hypothetical protein
MSVDFDHVSPQLLEALMPPDTEPTSPVQGEDNHTPSDFERAANITATARERVTARIIELRRQRDEVINPEIARLLDEERRL